MVKKKNLTPKNENEVLKEIKKIIGKYIDLKKYDIFIFGSRVDGKARKFSDYDIGILGKKVLPFDKMALIKDELEESDLPYRVDVVDFRLVSKDFREVALLKIKKI
jgi:hypothetical protein